MAERGGVVITAALIAAAATVAAALISRSDGGPATPPAATSIVSGTTTSAIPPEPAEPEPSAPGSMVPPAPEPAIPPQQILSADLGVSRPITQPGCEGSFIAVVGSAVHPPTYREEVQGMLDAHPGSEYLHTSDTCPSLRPRTDAGNEIYAVYYGPFPAREQACQIQDSWGEGSYVKVLDRVTESHVIIGC